MYCPDCGKYNEEKARFCRFCGARLEENTGEQFTQQGTVSQEPEEQNAQDYQNMQAGQEQQSNGYEDNGPVKKKGKKIWIILAAVLIIAAAAAAVVFLWILPQQREKNYKAHISDGNRYLEEMDYEKAEDSYLAAIEIEPKEPEPYLRLADIYEAQNEPEKVVEILKQGTENTDSPEIQEKYDLYTYVQDVLIPEEGQVKEGEYTCEYINQTMGSSVWTSTDPVHSEKGILTSRIRDFDNDGKEELLVLSMNNEARVEEYTLTDQNEVILRMYEYRDGEVVLSDEMTALSPVFGVGDSECSGIFLHEYDGQIYICGSLIQDSYVIADGIKFYSFVSVYNGESFEKQAGTDEAVIGSEFSGEEQDAQEMADFLDEIGLSGEAEQIRDSWLRCFEFTDDVEMLMLITGENDLDTYPSDYWDTLDTDLLGEVTLTLRLTWNDAQSEKEDQKPEEDGNEADENQDVQAAASQAQDAYDNLLDSGEYNNYISEWLTSPESYTILDINQDQIPELMVHSADDGTGWSNTLLFAYDSEAQEAKMVQDIYHYMDIRYSAKYKAIVYSDVRSSLMYGGSGFFVLDGTELTQAFSVGWDNTSYENWASGTDENHYFIFQGDTRTEITEAQNDEYFDELSDIEKTQL